MEHIAPLIQTILWVGLIAAIVWRFHSPIYGLLVALQKRIEGGSNIKAGPFEISDQLKPQDPIAQKEKVAGEVQEALEDQNQAEHQIQRGTEGVVAGPQLPVSVRSSEIQARYFQAEDLVLRSLQAEYGVPASRQVTAGRDGGFDGLFLSSGRTTVVEVKYIGRGGRYPRIKASIQRLTQAIRDYGWEHAQIVLALVYEDPEDVKHAREMLSSAFSENAVPVVVREFAMSQLRHQFGVGDENPG